MPKSDSFIRTELVTRQIFRSKYYLNLYELAIMEATSELESEVILLIQSTDNTLILKDGDRIVGNFVGKENKISLKLRKEIKKIPQVNHRFHQRRKKPKKSLNVALLIRSTIALNSDGETDERK